ncbi:MAG: hypothetical protein INR73_13765 [Williamsia sp.]|nr:hypothetical protein [Williamsia sp.]
MKVFLSTACLCLALCCSAQHTYHSLDPRQPIQFFGNRILFKEDTITLGPKAFFIDGALPDSLVASHPYVFNSVNKAAAHLTQGTEAAPMVLYLAPWVYWIDDPDDPAIRTPKEGATPYGLVINCEWLRFQGLTNNPENVVLACNRGQTIGAQGNFTMFRFIGQGTRAENLTFGNYCNVDLAYPLKPALGRPKRASAIVQAQLIHCNGDKIVARNTRFISRLNLCPFVGGKRVLFDRCHFESTDDALCGTGVYLHSTLDFYASKPFYNTTGTGAVLLDCDIRSFAGNQQYFTKAKGQVTAVDCRFTAGANTYWGWQDVVPRETRNYQSNITLNGQPLLIGRNDPASTVNLQNKPLLNAYRFVLNGKPVYNTYNLLRGSDDWDPMGIKPLVAEAERSSHATYTSIPVQLQLTPTGVSVETGKGTLQLKANLLCFGNYPASKEKLQWTLAPQDRSLVKLQVADDGMTCTLVPANNQDEARQVVVSVSTPSGLEAASVIRVSPSILEAPAFTSTPTITAGGNGSLRVQYALNTKYSDHSAITWYRCRDAAGSDPIEVAVTRNDQPLRAYPLSAGDIGYYLMVSVAPKHIRSKEGEAVRFIMRKPVQRTDVKEDAHVLTTDFRNVSTRNQPQVMPGFWTWDNLAGSGGSQNANNAGADRDAWYYGEGSDGAADLQGLLQGRSGSMCYTPVKEQAGDMKLTLQAAPFKTAGQGFSVAHLYIDILIKADTKSKSGYALRLIRTTKYHDAVDCLLMKYENGKATPVSEPVSTTAFRSPCTITVEVKDNKLLAQVSTKAPDAGTEKAGVVKEVKLETPASPLSSSGFGIEYNGGSPTLIQNLKVVWKG